MMTEWIISSSVVIAAVLAVRLALRGKISLRLQYALWAVVLIRLLLPFQLFTSSFGAGAIAREADLSEPIWEFYVSSNAERYNQAYDDAVRHVAERHVGVSEFVALEQIEHEAHALAQRTLELDLSRLLYHIWFLGTAVMTAVIVACNLHLSRRLKHRRQEMDIPGSLLPVYVTAAVPTPCIYGFFRPAVYLTPAAARDKKLLHHVLTHELTHYRHLDHIWSVLRSLCLVLHWYNPLVWAAVKVSRADAELACDEGTLAVLGEAHRGEYGRTLIGLTCTDHDGSMFITATTMTGSAGSLRERIRLLMKRPRNTVLSLTAMILLVTAIVGCAFSTAPESAPTETTPPETTAPAVDDGSAETGSSEQELTQTELTYALALKQAMEAYADKNPRELTPMELEAFQRAFSTFDENGNVNPAACFLLPYYSEIWEMDGNEFLAYFPTDQGATEEEFELLKAKYPDFLGEWTWETMPLPIHSYSAKEIEAVVSRWGNIHWQELDEGVHYLEETGLYYNYTSDFGLGGFYARCGFVYDGGAVVYSAFSALFFTETMGSYTIRAHLPILYE